MLFSLSILILNSFLLHADPPHARAAERTQVDPQIDAACAPRMAQGVDHYAACVADKTREAEAAESRRLAEVRHMKEIIGGTAEPDPEPIPERVCNPDAALRSCTEASSSAARANNPSSTDQQILQALRSCRSACNPHLSGCTNITSLKQTMLQTMNNCGVGSGSVAQNEEDESTWTGWATSKFNAITTQAGNWWDQQTEAQAKRQDEVARMISINEAPFAGGGGSAAVSRRTPGAVGDPLLGSTENPITATDGVTPNGEFPQSALDSPTGLEISPRPQSRPENLGEDPTAPPVPPRDARDTAAQTPPGDTNNDQQVVTPVQPNEPVPYQPGNFAGLQSAMNSPPGGMASSSSMGGGEVSNGGSSSGGSYSGSSTNPVSRPLAFAGSGQVSPSALRGTETPAAPTGGGSQPAMDVAAPGGGSRGGSLADFGGGRMMASSRPTGPASLESSMTTAMRSDSYYRTAGGRAAGAAARAVAKRSATCKGPNCPRKTPAGIAAANCDGNPQCLLALTGKLQGPRQQATEEVWETDSSGVRRIRAKAGERGIASVQRSTEPGGVVRGKIQDVLNHLGSSEVFKVDHDGMLDVDL